jgi:Zn-finger protein
MKHEELVEAYYSCENKKEQFEYLIFTEVYKNMDRVNYYFCHFNNFSDKYKSGALMAGTIYLCSFYGGELVVGAGSKYFEIRNGNIYDDREYYFCKSKEHAESIIDSMHHID